VDILNNVQHSMESVIFEDSPLAEYLEGLWLKNTSQAPDAR
jgi:hypothetical protein